VVEEPGSQQLISVEARQCIEATSDCYQACAETLNYSLNGGAFADFVLMRRLIDCSEAVQAAQNALLRGSEVALMLAAVCVEACENVAERCRSLGDSDPQLAACAEVCDETAEACRRLAI
jgi:hypothetical protein